MTYCPRTSTYYYYIIILRGNNRQLQFGFIRIFFFSIRHIKHVTLLLIIRKRDRPSNSSRRRV